MSVPHRRIERTVQIYNRNISTTDNQGLTHDQAKSSRSARHNTDSILQAEARKRPLHMRATSTLHRFLPWKIFLFRILHTDVSIGSRMLSFMLKFASFACCAVLVEVIVFLFALSDYGRVVEQSRSIRACNRQ
jgi:hypothetical protein